MKINSIDNKRNNTGQNMYKISNKVDFSTNFSAKGHFLKYIEEIDPSFLDKLSDEDLFKIAWGNLTNDKEKVRTACGCTNALPWANPKEALVRFKRFGSIMEKALLKSIQLHNDMRINKSTEANAEIIKLNSQANSMDITLDEDFYSGWANNDERFLEKLPFDIFDV